MNVAKIDYGCAPGDWVVFVCMCFSLIPHSLHFISSFVILNTGAWSDFLFRKFPGCCIKQFETETSLMSVAVDGGERW